MISRLTGKLIELEPDRLVIDCSGVGYEVNVPEGTEYNLPSGSETISMFIRQIWRDDGPSLYGFLDSWSRKLFDLLITVNGVGPKSALALIGAVGSDGLAQTIALGDIKTLQKIPGIGEKTAARIVLELSKKLATAAFERNVDKLSNNAKADAEAGDAIEALCAMGFRPAEAREAIKASLTVMNDKATVEDLVKEALKRVRTRA